LKPTIELLVNIDVDDLERAIVFYRDALGLSVGRRFGETGAEMVGASSPVWLLAKPAGTAPARGIGRPRSYARHWTPVHLDFVVDDVQSAVWRALAAGAELEDEIAEHAWGRIAHMADPFGHGLCLIEFIGRGYDEIL